MALLALSFSFSTLRGDPLVVVPQGNLTCSVTVTYHGTLPKGTTATSAKASTTGGPVLQNVAITRTGNLRRDLSTWSDGTTYEAWIMEDTGMMVVERTMGTSKFIYEFPKNSISRNPFSPVILQWEAGALGWINPQTLIGDSTQSGTPAVLYQAPMSLPTDLQTPDNELYQAWVDKKTLVPLALDDGKALYELTFSGPPKEQLVMPERFKTALQHYYNANATIRHL